MASNIFNTPFSSDSAGTTAAAVCIATISANQTITNSVLTTVAFDTTSVDTQSMLDTSTYKFTPTVAGYYQVSFNGTLGDGTSTLIIGQIMKNSDIIADTRASATTQSEVGVLCSTIVYMDGEDDYLTGIVWHNNSSSTSLFVADGRTRMAISFLGT